MKSGTLFMSVRYDISSSSGSIASASSSMPINLDFVNRNSVQRQAYRLQDRLRQVHLGQRRIVLTSPELHLPARAAPPYHIACSMTGKQSSSSV